MNHENGKPRAGYSGVSFKLFRKTNKIVHWTPYNALKEYELGPIRMNAKYSQKSRQYILVLKKNVIIA